eukprot:6180033-Pleurochrysis_carterae.AAC.1
MDSARVGSDRVPENHQRYQPFEFDNQGQLRYATNKIVSICLPNGMTLVVLGLHGKLCENKKGDSICN